METTRFIIIVGLWFLTYQVLIILFNYIQSLIKSEKFSLEKNEKYFVLAFIVALVVGLSFFQKEDVLTGLKVGLFMSVMLGLFLLIVKFGFSLSGPTFKNRQSVESVDKKGFKITNGSRQKQYLWRDIQWIKFDKKKFKLILKEKKRLEFDLKTGNLYYLLKNIPSGYADFDYTFIKDFYSKLKTCEVCGTIAFSESECLSCGCTTWTTELQKGYANYEEYVKENQLDFFATMEKGEKFNDFKIADKNFEFDSTWRPIVTKKEVLEYSEKEYWEKD